MIGAVIAALALLGEVVAGGVSTEHHVWPGRCTERMGSFAIEYVPVSHLADNPPLHRTRCESGSLLRGQGGAESILNGGRLAGRENKNAYFKTADRLGAGRADINEDVGPHLSRRSLPPVLERHRNRPEAVLVLPESQLLRLKHDVGTQLGPISGASFPESPNQQGGGHERHDRGQKCEPGLILCESDDSLATVGRARLLYEVGLLGAVLLTLLGAVIGLGLAGDGVGYRAKGLRLALGTTSLIASIWLAGALVGGGRNIWLEPEPQKPAESQGRDTTAYDL